MAAMGIIKKARELDIKIPSNIAIVGYDNIEVSALTTPALTTIEQPIIEMGEKAYELVTISKDAILKEPQNIRFEPKLIKRDSA
jgi:DNA-binding LacI/PurR family transcriptional regulator